MGKSRLIGALTGVLLNLLWIIFFPQPISQKSLLATFLIALMITFNFIALQCFVLSFWAEPSSLMYSLRYVFVLLHVMYYGFLGMILSSITGNWVILPLMLVPIINVFTYIGVALLLGIIGMGDTAINVMLNAPFLSAPLFVIPLTALAGDVVVKECKKLKLNMIESRIKKLQSTVKKHEQLLLQRSKLEEEIRKIISLDPANLSLKEKLFRRDAQTLTDVEAEKRINEMREKIQKAIELRRRVEEKLRKLENEREMLKIKVQEVKHALHEIEIMDPANIGIKLQKLSSQWKGMKQQELQKVMVASELERLFKEHLLLGFKIKEKDNEIGSQKRELDYMKLKEASFMLERIVHLLEKMDRDIKRKEPQLLEINDELERLKTKRQELRASLKSTMK